MTCAAYKWPSSGRCLMSRTAASPLRPSMCATQSERSAAVTCGTRQRDTVAGEDDRSPRAIDQRDRIIGCADARRRLMAGRGIEDVHVIRVVVAGALLGVLGDIDEHRSRTARARNGKRF